MNFCPTCGNFFEDEAMCCTFDEKALERLKDPLVGAVLGGKYRLCGKMGEGGMRLVQDAVNLGVERSYAMKILPLSDARDETMKKPQSRDRLLASMSHCSVRLKTMVPT